MSEFTQTQLDSADSLDLYEIAALQARLDAVQKLPDRWIYLITDTGTDFHTTQRAVFKHCALDLESALKETGQ